MSLVPWVLMGLNILGAGIMVRYGLPKDVPLVGREDADPLLGFVGLGIFGMALAIRIALTVTAAG